MPQACDYSCHHCLYGLVIVVNLVTARDSWRRRTVVEMSIHPSRLFQTKTVHKTDCKKSTKKHTIKIPIRSTLNHATVLFPHVLYCL